MLTNSEISTIQSVAMAKTKQHIKESEDAYKSKPTPEDINNCKTVLKGFGIKVKKITFPEFDTYRELEVWQRKMIKKVLDNA